MPDGSTHMPVSPLGSAQARAVRGRLRRLIHDAGQTDLAPHAVAPESERFWELEPAPVVLAAGEWETLSAGLIQRAQLVNALLRDVYSAQAALHARLLPPEVILADPHYLRPCLNLEPNRASPATLLRFDLQRAGSSWAVTGIQANTPVGLSYAVQNRRFLSQEAPQLYSGLPDYESIINTPLQVLEALRRLCPRPGDDISIVVLTAGPHDPFYSEHSFLARKMGLPLARGDDLLVLDNRVYFKSIAGLEPVDVIYRRLGGAHIDPVVFPTERQTAGVAGLLQCIRSGTVVVANAIGTGLAESRALEAYLPQLCRFYLGQDLKLPGPPTHLCTDADELQALGSRFGQMRLRSIHPPAPLADSGEPEPDTLIRPSDPLPPHVAAAPYRFVLQPVETPLPDSSPDSGGGVWSTFVIAQGSSYRAVPGALLRLHPAAIAANRIGVTTDVIVLRSSSAEERAPAAPAATPRGSGMRTALGSRSAEALYWIGRYLERAESTARMLSILDDVVLEEIPATERSRWLPVLQGLFEAAGYFEQAASPREALSPDEEVTWRMTLDRAHPGSIHSSISAAAENARQLRDCLSPEVWVAFSHLLDELESLHRVIPGPAERTDKTLAVRQAVQQVTTGVNSILGTAERTLLQDETWWFLRIGLHLERAVMTCSALRRSLGAERLTDFSSRLDRDDPELSALVRMLGSQDAYRRLYQSPSVPRLVADFFLHQPGAPRSIRHNVERIATLLHSIQDQVGNDLGALPPVLSAIETLRTQLSSLRLEEAEAGTSSLRGGMLSMRLSHLLAGLYDFHSLLSDQFFSHQGRLAPLRRSHV